MLWSVCKWTNGREIGVLGAPLGQITVSRPQINKQVLSIEMLCTFLTVEVTAMSEETLRSKNHLVLWLALAITLGPLVPYAARGTADRTPAQLGMQGAPQAPSIASIPAVERSS